MYDYSLYRNCMYCPGNIKMKCFSTLQERLLVQLNL